MAKPSSQKVVLITGCSSGIGWAMAQVCHNAGMKVLATARDTGKLEGLAKSGIETLKLDVNSESDLINIKEYINKTSQHVDFIINNAGIGLMAPMADLSEEDLHQQFKTNVYSIVKLTNMLLPALMKSDSPRIVNIGSVSGILTTPFAGAYCASKAALHAVSEAYRMELAPFGIKVLIVQPGAIASNFGNNASDITENLLKENSLYKNIESAIRRRAQASQENPSSAEDFARELLQQMQKRNPPPVIRIGNGSKILPILPRILKPSLLDKALSKPFQLGKLIRNQN